MIEWLLQQVDPLAQQLFTGGWNLLDLAWLGIFILMTMEEMGLPAPFVSDAVVLGLGYSSGVGHAQGVAKFVILLFLVVGSSLAGASAVYWAARAGSRPLLLRLSSRLGAQGHLERVESWMNRRSWAVIILARLTPGLLTASSVVAGTAGCPTGCSAFTWPFPPACGPAQYSAWGSPPGAGPRLCWPRSTG